MAYAFDSAYGELSARMDGIRKILDYADVGVLAPSSGRKDHASVEKAGVYVWLAAALEQFVKSFISGMLDQLNAVAVAYKDIRPSLVSVCEGGTFDRLQAVTRLAKWTDRVAVLDRVVAPEIAQFPQTHVPLDGRTIEPYHLEILWDVFAFPGDCLPHPRHKLALIDLAETRNALAHGEVDARTYGRRKTVADLRQLTRYIEDIGEHVYLSGMSYIDDRRYLR